MQDGEETRREEEKCVGKGGKRGKRDRKGVRGGRKRESFVYQVVVCMGRVLLLGSPLGWSS